MNVHGTFALAYYGPWRVRFTPDASLGTGWHAEPDVPRLHVIVRDEELPRAVSEEIRARPRRILVFAGHDTSGFETAARIALAGAGARLASEHREAGAVVLVYEAPRPG